MMRPLAALIRRELIGQLRHRTAFRNLLFLLVPLMALLCFLMYYANQNPNLSAGAPMRVYFFRIYTFVLYIGCLLTATAMGALGICTEREQDTYDLLRLTHLSPSAIIVAKLASALGVCLLTVIAALPLMGLQFFFTGVEPQGETVSP